MNYIIGDIHGCFKSFLALLEKIPYTSNDHFYLIGDIVNKGPQSLELLEWIYNRKEQFHCLMGNHELRLLRIYFNLRHLEEGDPLQKVIESPDKEKYIEWVRSWPFVYFVKDTLLVHAGIYPDWDEKMVRNKNEKLQEIFKGPEIISLLRDMDGEFGNDLSVFTRMRFLKKKKCDFDVALHPKDAPEELVAWYKHSRKTLQRIFFGHWALLGFADLKENAVCMDSGLIYGGKLSCWNVEENKLISQDCLEYE